MSFLSFPQKFFWGASTSSYQVEGNCTNNWSQWEVSPARLEYLQESGQLYTYGEKNFLSDSACDHYHRYREDFLLAKQFGHNATRLSLEWSRIEPQKGIFDEKEIARYQDVFQTLVDLGITPFFTLFHWTLPVWLSEEGGFESPHIQEYFSRYTKKMVESFPHVKYWITLNEPEIFLGNSYFKGVWPPQKKSLVASVKVLYHLIRAHKAAYLIIHQTHPLAKVAIAKNNIYFEAGKKDCFTKTYTIIASYFWNDFFLNRIKKYQDFVGLNYYFHNRMEGRYVKNENKRVSDMGWELFPEGIYSVLKDLQKYGIPVVITENGLADSKDEKRIWFLKETLKAVHKAIGEGVPVEGYLHWSLMDNFEWDKGFWPRFGLFGINYNTLERIPRPSAYYYREICQKNGLDGLEREEE